MVSNNGDESRLLDVGDGGHDYGPYRQRRIAPGPLGPFCARMTHGMLLQCQLASRVDIFLYLIVGFLPRLGQE